MRERILRKNEPNFKLNWPFESCLRIESRRNMIGVDVREIEGRALKHRGCGRCQWRRRGWHVGRKGVKFYLNKRTLPARAACNFVCLQFCTRWNGFVIESCQVISLWFGIKNGTGIYNIRYRSRTNQTK